MPIINPKVAQVFANDSQQMKFIAAGIEQLLGEEKSEALISEIMPEEAKPSPRYKGQLLVVFNGLSPEQLKRLHGFTDAEVDEVYEMMGVTKPEENDSQSDASVNAEEIASVGTSTDANALTTETTESGDKVAVVAEGESEAEVDAKGAAKQSKGNAKHK